MSLGWVKPLFKHFFSGRVSYITSVKASNARKLFVGQKYEPSILFSTINILHEPIDIVCYLAIHFTPKVNSAGLDL